MKKKKPSAPVGANPFAKETDRKPRWRVTLKSDPTRFKIVQAHRAYDAYQLAAAELGASGFGSCDYENEDEREQQPRKPEKEDREFFLWGFVAGPFRGATAWEVEQNIRTAEEVAYRLWQFEGVAVFCPHTNTRYFDQAIPDEKVLPALRDMIMRCDFVFVTPNWEKSEGARLEVDHAKAHDIPVFNRLQDLREWIHERRKI